MFGQLISHLTTMMVVADQWPIAIAGPQPALSASLTKHSTPFERLSYWKQYYRLALLGIICYCVYIPYFATVVVSESDRSFPHKKLHWSITKENDPLWGLRTRMHVERGTSFDRSCMKVCNYILSSVLVLKHLMKGNGVLVWSFFGKGCKRMKKKRVKVPHFQADVLLFRWQTNKPTNYTQKSSLLKQGWEVPPWMALVCSVDQ